MKRLLFSGFFSGLSLISASIAASNCCDGFNILAVVGLMPAGSCIGLVRYRLEFTLLTAVLLGIAFYLVYQKRSDTGMRFKTLPWSATVIAVGLILYPYYGNRVESSSSSPTTSIKAAQPESPQPQATAPAKSDRVVFKIEGQGKMKGMACAGCQKFVQQTLLGDKGVSRADVSLKKQEAVVEYESGKTNPEELIKLMKNAGFTATAKTK
jgi:copper chaperone